ncbi:glucan 1,3-beta-glucosidase [Mytilinidion resinicola]|uniref:Glucan 1,3-beta-glucosidase n=1 Tax=Mytilinidion resinicola TaxID=574789 RepID=A0A6A6Z6G2_9PEZI|nr:glucan 1,3-beta-glucosidase [Mytilinidion resinicola]KAF2816299.1 glucan 1,3-beta-glucosidase [Mytilinidion resinicola]
MVAFSTAALFVTLRVLFTATSSFAAPIAAPVTAPATPEVAAASSYWLADIKRQGTVAYGASDFKIFRNVKDYGATGDGSTDDTAAINQAVSDGNRCGQNCDSSTVTPALVYFPPGTYVVSKPIIQYYYTQFVGDAVTVPTIKAAAGFSGMAVIDSDPYMEGGVNWYTNQNNFFRQVRNFVIDLTAMPATAGAGIHWQVGQATSLQNIRFEMVKGGTGNAQQGIFMDNGSGGFMTDLTFNGGNYGAFFGNQQFTTRNLTFNDCNTAIFMNWNWAWTFQGVTINNCKVGIDMANAPTNQTVGSVLILDSTITNTPIGVNTSFTQDSIPTGGGTLVIDNVDFSGVQTAVQDYTGKAILAGGGIVKSWAQGQVAGAASGRVQDNLPTPAKPASLLNSQGNVFTKSRPQYENIPSSQFVSLKSKGATGDGATDDTAAIQAAINGMADGEILYVDHGAYVITKTVTVPAGKNIKMTGEMWPLFMASGKAFNDMANPQPVFQVGETSGDSGSFEMSDIVFETLGAAPGAILMEWNLKASELGAGGLWDVHFRVGGSAGTELQADKCAKNPATKHDANPDCIGSFLMMHITKDASAYLENTWFWLADHELDLSSHSQIDLYNGRGLLVESQGPVHLWGTAAEHSQLYNYQFANAKDIFYALIQTETPYMQPNPNSEQPFTTNAKYSDPDFSACTTDACKSAWGLRIVDSSSIWGYGSGTYSFFSNYNQDCLATNSCQENMISVEKSSNVNMFGISTKAATNMITQDGTSMALDKDNRSNFCATLGMFTVA